MMKETKVLNVKISNPNRIIYPKNKVTKLDCALYYEFVAQKMLKFLKNRPISVIRCHDNIYKEKFYKKHAQKNEDVERFFVSSKKLKSEEFFYIKTKKQLINQIQLGTVEFHTWNCKIENLDYPDYMIFDLDPDESVSIEKLRKATKIVKNFLNKLKLKCFLKTSGGKGYHVYAKVVNLSTKKVSLLSKQIAFLLEQNYPNIFVTNMSKEKRKDKIFIDYLRNKKGATCVCAYSLRLREGATISMPISWNKLDFIKPNEINIKNYKDFF